MAGAFLSLVGVPRESAALAEAVDRVISSYGRAENRDQVLVQPKLESVAISGVVMTRDLETGAPYYVINYDDFSGRTDSVTGGAESKTIVVHRDRPEALHSPRMRSLVRAVAEIEAITSSDRLDIEFCVTHADEIFILQVRALAASRNWSAISDHAVDGAVDQVRAGLRSTHGAAVGCRRCDNAVRSDAGLESGGNDWRHAAPAGLLDLPSADYRQCLGSRPGAYGLSRHVWPPADAKFRRPALYRRPPQSQLVLVGPTSTRRLAKPWSMPSSRASPDGATCMTASSSRSLFRVSISPLVSAVPN